MWKLMENIIEKDDIDALTNFLNNSDRFTNGPKVKEFEKNFSRYIGSKYTVGLNSCTAALHIALAIHKFKKKKKIKKDE